MTRDAAKTQTDLDKASADMQAKQRDFKVRAVVSCRSPGLACVTRRGNLKVCLSTFAIGRLVSHRPAQQKGFRRTHWLLHESRPPCLVDLQKARLQVCTLALRAIQRKCSSHVLSS